VIVRELRPNEKKSAAFVGLGISVPYRRATAQRSRLLGLAWFRRPIACQPGLPDFQIQPVGEYRRVVGPLELCKARFDPVAQAVFDRREFRRGAPRFQMSKGGGAEGLQGGPQNHQRAVLREERKWQQGYEKNPRRGKH